MADRSYAAQPLIETAGPLPDVWADHLAHARVDTSTRLPAQAELRFRDGDHQLLAATGITLGTPLKVFVTTVHDRTKVPLFTGEVTAVETELDATGAFTVLRAQDRLHRLTRARRTTAYPNASVKDVLTQIAARAGLTVGTVDAPTTRHPQVTQPHQSDWDFLRELATLYDADLTLEGTTLSFTRPATATKAPSPTTSADQSPYVLEYGTNLLSLRACVTATGQIDSLEVRGWNTDTKQPLTATAPATASTRLDVGTTPQKAAAPFGKTGTVLAGTGYALRADLPAAATGLAAQATAALADLDATITGTPQLRAGTPIALANVGTPFTGRYTTTAVTHLFDPSLGYRTRLTVTPDPSPPAGTTTGTHVVAGPLEPAAGALPGLAIALVTDTKEPGATGCGAVRLTFPWLSADYTTDWVRTLQTGGLGGGGVLSPGIGDEVLVGFEHGRLDRPLVLGSLYNGKDRPTQHTTPLIDASTGHVNRRSLAMRSGDRIELLDAKNGDQGIRLTTADGKLALTLERHAKTLRITATDGPVEITGKQITVNAKDGPLNITAAKNLTLDADTIALKATKNLTLEGQNITAQANTNATLKATSKAVVTAPKVEIA
ncbi:VgrG-related protein [Streptomyces yunnanensis]|uniref:Phage late control gene D protein (GPD) n=1 Tax=Streptomyces yunnanensis TaxID=156453 RepID=A0A9X8N9T8_9ACTN|nr:VgrG-related protein [Streptomyces yunnanensis]SHN35783.1 Phage late control gene D protein (GPD) [Streptomyces yunnanensis]